MAGDDRRLQLVGAGSSVSGGADEELRRAGDELVVPGRSVLVFEEHECAVGVKASVGACPMQADERQEAGDLRFGGHEAVEQARQPLGVVDQMT